MAVDWRLEAGEESSASSFEGWNAAIFRSAAGGSARAACHASRVATHPCFDVVFISWGLGQPGRPAARSQAAIKFIDQPNQTADDSPAGGLEVATPEALQQNIGHKTGENEVHDGRGVVSEAMIQRQVCGEQLKQSFSMSQRPCPA